MYQPFSNFLTDRSKVVIFCISFLLFVFVYVCYTVLFVPCSLMVTCCDRADPLAFLFVMLSCVLSLSHMCSGLGVVLVCVDS